MREIRIFANIEFEELGDREDEFLREFDTFSETNSNPIDDMIQKMKAKEGKNAPEDMTIFLLAELHKKIDELTKLVKGDKHTYIELKNKTTLDFAWFDHLVIGGLKAGETYYARLEIPLFRPRPIPMFFRATDEGNAEISKIWARDRQEFDSYLASKEREEIAMQRLG